MNFRINRYFLFAGIMLPVLFFAGFRQVQNNKTPEYLVQEKFMQNIHDLSNAIKDLQERVSLSETINTEHENVIHLFYTIREKYKQLEFLLAYIDPEGSENFNGANLLSGDPNVLSTQIIYPRGMQVIEELLFDERNEKNYPEIKTLCQQLLADINLFKIQIEKTNLSTTMIMDACRKEIIRICFLGLTGFDSPIAKNSIPEAVTALKSLQATIYNYHASINDTGLFLEINKKFDEAIMYLKSHPDFNSFDRLYFTREYGNTLYAMLLDIHIATQAAFPGDITDFNLPVNYNAKKLFDEDLLNADFFDAHKIDKPTTKRIELGKLLFFDPVLSANNKRACASCHQPEKAFTDGLTKSIALDFKGTIKRNAPTLINAALQGSYFYDVRAEFPETQIDHVVFHADEFNTTYEAIIEKLKQSAEYISLFKEAFPEQPGNAINGFTITKSVADYVRSLIAMDSEFDKYMRNEKENISENVKNGYNLFMGKAQCGTCHFAPTFYGTVPPDFTDSETEVLGVPSTNDTLHAALDIDKGRYDIQNVPVYEYAFKTQTVRNISLTAPYMHNGVYTTLEEVLDFYNRGGAAGLNIKLEFQTLPADKLNLTKTEIADIISFMQSLTDTTGITSIPAMLPSFPKYPELNTRKIGGEY